ncbi:MAG: YhcB family protein [Cellvibrionaceae bacterium]
MFSTGAIITVFIAALLLGVGIGILFSRLFKSISGNSTTLKEKLAEKEQQLADYQSDVTEHFLETSRRVNTLTKNYKDVHEYLATSAAKLANPDMNKDGFSAQITLADKIIDETEDAKIIEQDIQEVLIDENTSIEDGIDSSSTKQKHYEPI